MNEWKVWGDYCLRAEWKGRNKSDSFISVSSYWNNVIGLCNSSKLYIICTSRFCCHSSKTDYWAWMNWVSYILWAWLRTDRCHRRKESCESLSKMNFLILLWTLDLLLYWEQNVACGRLRWRGYLRSSLSLGTLRIVPITIL